MESTLLLITYYYVGLYVGDFYSCSLFGAEASLFLDTHNYFLKLFMDGVIYLCSLVFYSHLICYFNFWWVG